MNKTLAIILVIATLSMGGAAYYMSSNAEQPEAMPKTIATLQEEASTSTQAVTIDVEAALKERILGDIKAPIRISEHSSFTCGHCGGFHNNSFQAVKAQLIDTGKAYLVFSDFPLNAPALHASMIARCMPQDKYFDFVDLLFLKQADWAYGAEYIKNLQTMANDYGMDTPTIKACLASKELQAGILGRMTASKTQWKIGSTPSFVINNKTVIAGALPPEEFIKKVIEATEGTSGE